MQTICDVFKITPSQLFAEDDESISLTEFQQKLLKCWAQVSKEKQDAVLALIEKM